MLIQTLKIYYAQVIERHIFVFALFADTFDILTPLFIIDLSTTAWFPYANLHCTLDRCTHTHLFFLDRHLHAFLFLNFILTTRWQRQVILVSQSFTT